MRNERRVVSILNDNGDSSPDPSSCGFDLWQSPEALRWLAGFLHGVPTTIRVARGSAHAVVRCMVRRVAPAIYFASAHPYGKVEGDVDLFWSSASTLRGAFLRHGLLRLEIPLTGEYLAQLPTAAHRGVHIVHSLDAVRHIVDLPRARETAGDLDSHFDPRIRWAIRKATRNGCAIRSAVAEDVDLLQELYARTMRAKRAPVNYGSERWRGMLCDLQPAGRAKIYIGEIQGNAVGFAAAADGRHSRHLIQLAVPPEAHATRVGELLVATAMREASENDQRFFDFMASPIRDKGLIAFKSKWGTEQQPILHAAIFGVPVVSRIIDLGRWVNRAGARFRAS